MISRLTIITLIALALALAGIAVSGMTATSAINSSAYDIAWHRIAAGGETFSTGSDYELGGTIGQHEAGAMAGGPAENHYVLAGGFWTAAAATAECPITGDLNCDGVVDETDLLLLLSQWGECPDPDNCPADLNGDGVVDGDDLLLMLSIWG